MKTYAIATVLFAAVAPVMAAPFYDDLEGATPSNTTRTSGVTGLGEARFSVAGEPALGNRSYRLNVGDAEAGYSRLSYTSIPGPAGEALGKLRDTAVSFQTYLDEANAYTLTPYVLLGLDNDGDGAYESATESLVIQFSSQIAGTPTKGSWLTEGLNSTSSVHVQVDRGTLPLDGPGDFQPDETPDAIAGLYDTSYNGTTLWGDLDVRFVRIGFGNFGPDSVVTPLTAYVDNVSAVPEPASLAVLGLGSAALLLRRRRASV